MKLEKNHPELAARLWRAQGLRIVDAGKSKYYDAAVSNFERAKRLLRACGARFRVGRDRAAGAIQPPPQGWFPVRI
jgi:antirestriction protein ArdC